MCWRRAHSYTALIFASYLLRSEEWNTAVCAWRRSCVASFAMSLQRKMLPRHQSRRSLHHNTGNCNTNITKLAVLLPDLLSRAVVFWWLLQRALDALWNTMVSENTAFPTPAYCNTVFSHDEMCTSCMILNSTQRGILPKDTDSVLCELRAEVLCLLIHMWHESQSSAR